MRRRGLTPDKSDNRTSAFVESQPRQGELGSTDSTPLACASGSTRRAKNYCSGLPASPARVSVPGRIRELRSLGPVNLSLVTSVDHRPAALRGAAGEFGGGTRLYPLMKVLLGTFWHRLYRTPIHESVQKGTVLRYSHNRSKDRIRQRGVCRISHNRPQRDSIASCRVPPYACEAEEVEEIELNVRPL
jgi:hypothetical protein